MSQDGRTPGKEPALMQRVRIGVTGLACVFLLVVFAAALFGLVGGEEAGTPATNTLAASEAPREPLAELGVTPGGTPEPATTNSTQPLPPVGAN